MPQSPVVLAGTHGKFDFIKVDPGARRLLACHTGNGTLDVVDLDTGRLIQSLPTGAAQGVAIDPVQHRYYVSVSKPPQLVIVDTGRLQIIGKIALAGPADLVAFEPEHNRVFVCNDAEPVMWVIDPVTQGVVKTLHLPGAGLEDLGFDQNVLFQCLKEASQVVPIDPQKLTIDTGWSTTPANHPHGQAILAGHRILIAGGEGKLALFALPNGQLLASANIAPRVDEIAYDSIRHCCYGASGTGLISVVQVVGDRLTPQAPAMSSPGAHSVAVDEKTGTVWIAYVGADQKPRVQAYIRP